MTLKPMKTFQTLTLGFVLAFLLLAGYGTALAQRPVTDDEVNAVAKQLYCPVCENVSLDVCPTQACAQWRDLIREKLSAGETAAQIKDYFVLHYGDRVLATPPARGLNWLVYLLPPVTILAGAFVLFRAFSSWKQPLPDTPPETIQQHETDEYVKRLEEELRQR
jgi:cytochrome c-type biogenesis protein CcmH